MTFIRDGYVCRRPSHKSGRDYENVYSVKKYHKGINLGGCITLGEVMLPVCCVGKKIRFKLEIIEDDIR